MTFTSLRHLLVAAAIVVFGHLCASDVRCQTIDRDTRRHGMHVCPEGQFVVGVHVRDDLLRCAGGFGDYSQADEVVDSRTDERRETLVQGMHACPEGMAMTGLHVRDNKLTCAPVNRSIPRFVDAGTNVSSGGVTMHSCPRGPVAGIHVDRNLLLCGTSGRTDSAAEFVDAATLRNGMHSCPVGFMVGWHQSKNLLLCSSEFGTYSMDDERTISSSARPHCPEGLAMTGIRRDRGSITCARVTGPPTQRIADLGTQRLGMHACPGGKPASGIDFLSNELICGTQGEPLRGMTITSVTPESPEVGELLVINGYQLGGSNEVPARDPRSLPSTTRNGVSGVALDQVTTRATRPGFGEGAVAGSGRRFWVPVIQHRPDRILVVIDQVTPGEYSLAIQDRNPDDFARAIESNAVSMSVRQPRPGSSQGAARTSMDATTVSRVHPRLAMVRQVLDVYGDFPFPDVNSLEVLLRPVGPDHIVFPDPNSQFQIVRPTAAWKNHLSVRLPTLSAGEWALSVRRRGGGPEGSAGRFFVRDTPPEQWEYESELIRGTGIVPFRLVAVEANVGPNGWSVDILGYGFGTNQGGRPLHVLTRDLYEGIRANVSARGSDSALHPVPAYLEASFWSETRIRVELPHRPGEDPTPGIRYVVIKERGREHWSNAIAVRIQ